MYVLYASRTGAVAEPNSEANPRIQQRGSGASQLYLPSLGRGGALVGWLRKCISFPIDTTPMSAEPGMPSADMDALYPYSVEMGD